MTVTENAGWTQIPATWTAPPAALLEQAKMQALAALDVGGLYPVAGRLADYYDRDLNYVGASLVELAPVNPFDLTATDLHAVALMSVEVGPGATRRLLDPGATRSQVLATLAAVPVEAELLVADPTMLVAMETMHLAVKAALSPSTVANPNAWVTASKLCARKRPALFPVRDSEVIDYLGLGRRNAYPTDWQVYRSLIGDRDVIRAIDNAREATVAAARTELRLDRLRLDVEPLRILDAALWTYKMALNHAAR